MTVFKNAVALLGLTIAELVLAKAGIGARIAALEASNSSTLQYPSQFTQNIMPKPIHSHNDYWRDVPLLTALSFGVTSVEADVWFINNTLFVGHEEAALTPDRTFDSLYVQPLVQILEQMNPKNAFTEGQTRPNGVWDTASDIPLQLLVDMKTNGEATLPPVLDALSPLRERGYLSTFTDGAFTQSAVLAIGTGNTPLAQVQALSPRDFFFDAPLTGLEDTAVNWDPTLSPIASTDFAAAVGWNGLGTISDAQLSNLTKFINDAKARGINSRFWNTPEWPVFARENIWRVLLNNGAFWLNADDLEAASQF
ncbi:hypothetical protein PC9H_003737 [Pleurotus ostreatus]|uniref:Altered inheritance of mitochondria protein 6 n=1 Tax=Pleurotus ostreatus TaxID=5322 RepID=A0A8H6ZYZ1_PLEOS|nr:uncharacterized protein PC9H_003737 [Pleurotus ostreatus]KAF7436903.1 hypothetical protein PC9H_003737 [Pleurotus ostreatus]KAJ8702704.1 hypothetical protein PTI98_001400 [Pleurotus ostreatus]